MDKQAWADKQKVLARGLAFDPRTLIGRKVVAVDLGGNVFERPSWVDARVDRVTFTFSDGTLATFQSCAAHADERLLSIAITEGEGGDG